MSCDMTPQRSWASKSKATTLLGYLPSWIRPSVLWPSHLLGHSVTRHSWCKLLDDISPVLQQNLANLGDQKTFHRVLFIRPPEEVTHIVQSMDPLDDTKKQYAIILHWMYWQKGLKKMLYVFVEGSRKLKQGEISSKKLHQWLTW